MSFVAVSFVAVSFVAVSSVSLVVGMGTQIGRVAFEVVELPSGLEVSSVLPLGASGLDGSVDPAVDPEAAGPELASDPLVFEAGGVAPG